MNERFIHIDVAGTPNVSVVCSQCDSQWFWPLTNGHLELNPVEVVCSKCRGAYIELMVFGEDFESDALGDRLIPELPDWFNNIQLNRRKDASWSVGLRNIKNSYSMGSPTAKGTGPTIAQAIRNALNTSSGE